MAINLSGMFQNLGGATDALSKSIMGSPVPEDPMQRNAMQRMGVTNPLLQQFGQGLGTALGQEMRSPDEQLKAAMRGVNLSDPRALLAMADKMKNIDPISAAKLVQAYETNQASMASKNAASYSGNDRFKDAEGNYYWATQQRTSQGPKMLVMDLQGNVVDPTTLKGLQRVDADGLTAAEKAEIERSKGFAEYDAKFYSELQGQIGASAAQDVNLKQLEDLLVDPAFEMSRLDQLAPDFLASDNMLVFRQLRNSLGLDVIGSTTFGALSESELNIALATALPPIKDKAKLLEWVKEKRRLEKVLRNEMLYATQLLRSGKMSADQVRDKMEERSSQNAKLSGSADVKLKPMTYTKQQWETTKRTRNMTDKELSDYLRDNLQIDAKVGG